MSVERLERGGDRLGERQALSDGLDGLEAVAGDAHAKALVARNAAALDELDRGGERRAAGGLGPNALGPREQMDRRDDLLVAHRLAPAAGLRDGLSYVRAVAR